MRVTNHNYLPTMRSKCKFLDVVNFVDNRPTVERFEKTRSRLKYYIVLLGGPQNLNYFII